MRLFPLATACLLSACTMSISPYKLDQPASTGHVESKECPAYFAPSFDPMPRVPAFSSKERADDTLFKHKLATYTEQLQDYIETEHRKQREAWREYARQCHLL